MDVSNVKNQTVIELLHKTEALARQELLGIKTKYCWDEVIFKFKAVQLLEDETADADAQDCALFLLNDSLDKKIVQDYLPSITDVTIPTYEQSYRGEIPNLTVMTNVNAMQKQQGWWWSITGNFTFQSVDYSVGDEIYWNSTGFHFYGGAGTGTAISGQRLQTGALVGGVDKVITHTLGREPYILQAKYGGNLYFVSKLTADPDNLTTKIIVQVEESLPDGLEITLI